MLFKKTISRCQFFFTLLFFALRQYVAGRYFFLQNGTYQMLHAGSCARVSEDHFANFRFSGDRCRVKTKFKVNFKRSQLLQFPLHIRRSAVHAVREDYKVTFTGIVDVSQYKLK